MENILFDSWESAGRTALLTVGGYFTMVFLLRISGKRTLSKMNAFDFVVTVGLGSMLATIALNKNVALLDGFIAIALLVFLQYALTALSVRSKTVKRIITSQPTLLLYQGEAFEGRMKKERISMDELHSAVREAGHAGLENIAAIILETTGDLTVISKINAEYKGALRDVEDFPTDGDKRVLRLKQEGC